MTDKASSEGDRLKEIAVEILRELTEVVKAAADEAETFVREKPVAGAAAAFVAGWVLSSLFRR